MDGYLRGTEDGCHRSRLYSYRMVFTNVPIPCEMKHRTSSPSFSQTFGFLPFPIPGGVPVIRMVPAFKVVPCERYEMTLRVHQLKYTR